MHSLTPEQMKEVSEVINHYSVPADTEEQDREEKRRQKLIAFLKGEKTAGSMTDEPTI